MKKLYHSFSLIPFGRNEGESQIPFVVYPANWVITMESIILSFDIHLLSNILPMTAALSVGTEKSLLIQALVQHQLREIEQNPA